ncbi:MAG: hypothetical protein IT546_17220 [Caulobacteraceae bacterium]|nr:hypothetical protein [Caulobacteraceae bacterium]
MARSRWVAVITLAIIGCVLAYSLWRGLPVAKRWFDVDSCLDSGGAYIYEIDRCSHSQTEIDRYRLKGGLEETQ